MGFPISGTEVSQRGRRRAARSSCGLWCEGIAGVVRPGAIEGPAHVRAFGVRGAVPCAEAEVLRVGRAAGGRASAVVAAAGGLWLPTSWDGRRRFGERPLGA